MEQQIIYGRWIEIEGSDGTTFVHFDSIFCTPRKKSFTPSNEVMRDFYDGDEIYGVRVIDGYGARLHMPGFMDCTPWGVYETETLAVSELNSMYED